MMDRFTMYPMAFVTTIQPYLLGWILAISLFLTITVVALWARKKTWKQIVAMSGISYVIVTTLVLLTTTFALDIRVVNVEMIWVPPKTANK